jgi:LacI family transcriptional regulator
VAQTPKASTPSTLVEVARRAGVSPSTVSRTLSGSAQVSEAKRRAVEQAVDALNFRPNALAQSLKRGRSMTVGVLTPALDSPLLNETLRGVDNALTDQAYVPLIVSGHWSAEEEMTRVELLISQRVDGLVVLSSSLLPAQLDGLAQRLPIVAIGKDGGHDGALTIKIDNQAGGYLATRHLLALGHRRIVHIQGARSRASSSERLAGYLQAMNEYGVAVDDRLVVQGDWFESSGELAVQQLIAEAVPFTAVFAANDQMACGARLALYRQGLRVPQDVSLVGFDAIPASAFMTPPLTTVSMHMFDVGRMAARALIESMTGAEPVCGLAEPALIVRESTAQLNR